MSAFQCPGVQPPEIRVQLDLVRVLNDILAITGKKPNNRL
jgi:hypothetical protein